MLVIRLFRYFIYLMHFISNDQNKFLHLVNRRVRQGKRLGLRPQRSISTLLRVLKAVNEFLTHVGPCASDEVTCVYDTSATDQLLAAFTRTVHCTRAPYKPWNVRQCRRLGDRSLGAETTSIEAEHVQCTQHHYVGQRLQSSMANVFTQAEVNGLW